VECLVEKVEGYGVELGLAFRGLIKCGLFVHKDCFSNKESAAPRGWCGL
jgi:hypothetical protein